MIIGLIFPPKAIFKDITGQNAIIPSDEMIYGAWLAEESIFKAVIKYGSLNEYHFFTVLPNNELFNKLYKKSIFFNNPKFKNIKIIELDKLPFCFQKTKYNIFFSTFNNLYYLSYLRLSYASEIFPITSMAYTVSYPYELYKTFFKNMLSNLYFFDSIFCISYAQRKVIKNINKFIINSLKNDNDIKVTYKGRLDYLPLGIDSEDYDKIDKNDAKNYFNISKDKIVILYFGRFSIYDKMDLHPILLALKELSKKRKNITLIFAGRDLQGNYASKIKKMAKEMNISRNIKFYLNPSGKMKHLLFAASDIFISPSDNIQESFGLTILEAMAYGLPVVASDWDGYRELVQHNRTGFLIPTHWLNCGRNLQSTDITMDSWQQDHLYAAQSVSVDIKKMIEYLSILIENRKLRLEFGSNGKNIVAKKYDWSVLIPKYEKLWKYLSDLSQNYEIKNNMKWAFIPQYFDFFKHYATKIIKDDSRVVIAEYGIYVLKTKKVPYVPYDLQSVILTNILFLILTFLYDRNDKSVKAIKKYIKVIFKTADINIDYHIMWMLKKGLIELV